MATDQIVFGTGTVHARDVFEQAWTAGYRVFDTAVYYANDDELIGALEDCGASDDVRLIHKVQPHRVSDQFDRLIRPKLGGRPLDTLLLHHPALFVFDARPEALMRPWRELEKLVERGLVRRIGLSNAGRAFVDYLFEHASVQPQVNQIECHPWHYDADLIRSCRERGIEVQCFSPLGGGRAPVLETSTIEEIARAEGRSSAQVCIRWLLQKSLVPIVRASDPRHMRDNRQALTFTLDDAQMQAIDRLQQSATVWDDPIKRGCYGATITPTRIRVPNRLRFAIRSAIHYLAVGHFLRKQPRAT